MSANLKRALAAVALAASLPAHAILITNPDDARVWQGATVGTFAQLFYGSNTLANRQQVVTNQLLDDGNFDPAGYTAGTLTSATGVFNPGTSLDQPNVSDAYNGSYAYTCCSGTVAAAANAVDNLWVQTLTQTPGQAVWDLGFQATKAAIFNTIDHGPIPQEAIESTVYLSNDLLTWTQAVTERVWLEGIYSDTSVLWDGFVYAVGTGTSNTFRYASIIWGGPGALLADGDNEINGVMGLRGDFTPNPTTPVPEPGTLALVALGMLGACLGRRRSEHGQRS